MKEFFCMDPIEVDGNSTVLIAPALWRRMSRWIILLTFPLWSSQVVWWGGGDPTKTRPVFGPGPFKTSEVSGDYSGQGRKQRGKNSSGDVRYCFFGSNDQYSLVPRNLSSFCKGKTAVLKPSDIWIIWEHKSYA